MSKTLFYDAGRYIEIASRFDIGGTVRTVVPFGTGHINDTYLCTACGADGERAWILQRINHLVFTRPDLLMENVERVTTHIARKAVDADEDPSRATLSFARCGDGRLVHREKDGTWWRACRLVEETRSVDVPESGAQTWQAARAFGRFQWYLSDLPGPRLHETIPGFHDTPRRVVALADAAERDPAGRARHVQRDLGFVSERAERAGRLVQLQADGTLPERITHNDTKINNVLFDCASGEACCVIDLDTVMPGLAVFDFGDMVRTGASTAAEDERDPSLMGLDMGRYEQMAAGYLDGVGDRLAVAEVEQLAHAAWLITFEQAVRFLADYLDGDVYYKVSHPEHNLERFRTQRALVSDMERRAGDMARVVGLHR